MAGCNNPRSKNIGQALCCYRQQTLITVGAGGGETPSCMVLLACWTNHSPVLSTLEKTPWLEQHQAGQEQRLPFLGAQQHPNSVWLDDGEDSPQEHSRQLQ